MLVGRSLHEPSRRQGCGQGGGRSPVRELTMRPDRFHNQILFVVEVIEQSARGDPQIGRQGSQGESVESSIQKRVCCAIEKSGSDLGVLRSGHPLFLPRSFQ